jgi:hypothetical protein
MAAGWLAVVEGAEAAEAASYDRMISGWLGAVERECGRSSDKSP